MISLFRYKLYEDATFAALIDRYGDGSGGGALAQPRELPVVMVVGAGRGPIVRAALQAAKRCGIAIRVFALDKNPNAVITLRNLIRSEGWGDLVTVVSGDMRLWQAPCQADIMVHALRRMVSSCIYVTMISDF